MNLTEIKKSLEEISHLPFMRASPETISFLISEIDRLKLDEITRLCEFETMALENTRLKKEIEDINTKNMVLESQDSVARTAEDLVQSTNELNFLLPYVYQIRTLKRQVDMAIKTIKIVIKEIDYDINTPPEKPDKSAIDRAIYTLVNSLKSIADVGKVSV